MKNFKIFETLIIASAVFCWRYPFVHTATENDRSATSRSIATATSETTEYFRISANTLLHRRGSKIARNS